MILANYSTLQSIQIGKFSGLVININIKKISFVVVGVVVVVLRLTNSQYLHSRINHHLVWIHGSYYLPKANKKMYCFIDDLHLAQVINYFNFNIFKLS